MIVVGGVQLVDADDSGTIDRQEMAEVYGQQADSLFDAMLACDAKLKAKINTGNAKKNTGIVHERVNTEVSNSIGQAAASCD